MVNRLFQSSSFSVQRRQQLGKVLARALMLSGLSLGLALSQPAWALKPAVDSNPNYKPTKKAKMSTVTLETTAGNIVIEVNAEKAPLSSENFLQYARDGFYNGTVFHRVINGFMVQGGGFEPGMKQKTARAPIKNEADNGLKNTVYTVAMARTNDPHSASAQFFINVADNAFLNFSSPTPQGWGYAVFGKVVSGTEVVDKIKAVKTGSRGMFQDVPAEDVIITKTTVAE